MVVRVHVKTHFPNTLASKKNELWEKDKGYSIKVEKKVVELKWDVLSCDYSQFMS